MSGIILYGIAGVLLLISLIKDRNKTGMALIKAWKSFRMLLPQMFPIMLFVGISLAILSPETISGIMGVKSGVGGLLAGLVIGSVSLIPPFVAFPLAATLLKSGAGYPQIAAFVSTLMAVGVVTLPAEIKYLGKKTALLRNGMFFLVAALFSIIIGQVM